MTRKQWFNNLFFPTFQKMHPEVHLTYDIFTNKSREYGFDNRTKSQNLRDKAKELYLAEVQSINNHGNKEDLIKVVHVFMDYIESENAIKPHRTKKSRKYSKLDYDKVKKILPQFTQFDFNCWTAPIEGDHPEIQKMKIDFRNAYDIFEIQKDVNALIKWNNEAEKMYAENRKKAALKLRLK